jgi:hypothetical protein
MQGKPRLLRVMSVSTQILRRYALATSLAARALAPLVGVLLLSACKLAEVTTTPGDDLVVVEGMLRAGTGRDVILLHHTIQGSVVAGETGATVTVTGPGGTPYAFTQSAIGACANGLAPTRTDSLDVRATCYAAQRPGFVVSPGATYELRVTTQDGRQIRGRTTVPGSFAIRSVPMSSGAVDCALPPMTNLPLSWSVADGAWSYVTGMEIRGLSKALADTRIDAPDTLELTGVAVSETDTTLVVPADLGVFDIGTTDQRILKLLQDGFPDGVTVHLTIAAVDRNFVNSVRGGAFNPSGSVRISSVAGDGVGLFGSLVAHGLDVRVGTNLPFPPCLAR